MGGDRNGGCILLPETKTIKESRAKQIPKLVLHRYLPGATAWLLSRFSPLSRLKKPRFLHLKVIGFLTFYPPMGEDPNRQPLKWAHPNTSTALKYSRFYLIISFMSIWNVLKCLQIGPNTHDQINNEGFIITSRISKNTIWNIDNIKHVKIR